MTPIRRSPARLRPLALAAAGLALALPAAAQNYFEWDPTTTNTDWSRAGNWNDLDATPYAFPSQLEHVADFTEGGQNRTVVQDLGRALRVGGLEFYRTDGRFRYTLTGSPLHLGAYGINSYYGTSAAPVFDLDLRLLAPQLWRFSGSASFKRNVELGDHDLTLNGFVVFAQTVTSTGGRLLLSGRATIEAADTLAGIAVSGGTVDATGIADARVGNMAGGASFAALADGQIVRAGSLGGDGHLGALSGTGSFVKQGSGTMRLTGGTALSGNGVFVDGGVLRVEGYVADSAVTVRSSGRLEIATGAVVTLGDQSLTINAGRTAALGGGTLQGGFLRGTGTLQVGDASAASTVQRLRTANGSSIDFTQGASNFRLVEHGGQMKVLAGARVNVDDVRVSSGGGVEVAGVALTRNLESSGVLRVVDGGKIDNITGQIVLAAGSRTEVRQGGLIDLNGQTLELNAGLLVNNGRIDGTVNVNYGSLAKGAGYYGALVVGDGGRVIAGNSPGRLQLGALAWGAGGQFDVQIADAAAGAGIGWGTIDVEGTLSIDAGATPASRFLVTVASLDASHAPGLAVGFDPLRAWRWTLVEAGAVVGFSADRFALDLGAFRNPYDGHFSLSLDGSRLDLVYAPVPEPATWGLLGAGLVAIGLRRRRGARAADAAG